LNEEKIKNFQGKIDSILAKAPTSRQFDLLVHELSGNITTAVYYLRSDQVQRVLNVLVQHGGNCFSEKIVDKKLSEILKDLQNESICLEIAEYLSEAVDRTKFGQAIGQVIDLICITPIDDGQKENIISELEIGSVAWSDTPSIISSAYDFIESKLSGNIKQFPNVKRRLLRKLPVLGCHVPLVSVTMPPRLSLLKLRVEPVAASIFLNQEQVPDSRIKWLRNICTDTYFQDETDRELIQSQMREVLVAVEDLCGELNFARYGQMFDIFWSLDSFHDGYSGSSILLGFALALASSVLGPVPAKLVATGEVGQDGVIRNVSEVGKKVETVPEDGIFLLPKANECDLENKNVKCKPAPVSNLEDAFFVAFGNRWVEHKKYLRNFEFKSLTGFLQRREVSADSTETDTVVADLRVSREYAEQDLLRFVEAPLSDPRLCAVVGDSGSGKTNLVCWYIKRHLNRLKESFAPSARPPTSAELPPCIVFACSDADHTNRELTIGDVERGIADCFGISVPGGQKLGAVWDLVEQKALRLKTHVLVIIDGINEASDSNEWVNWVKKSFFPSKKELPSRLKLLVTSQTGLFDRDLSNYLYKTARGSPVIRLGEFSDDELDSAVAKLEKLHRLPPNACKIDGKEYRDILRYPPVLQAAVKLLLSYASSRQGDPGTTLSLVARDARFETIKDIRDSVDLRPLLKSPSKYKSLKLANIRVQGERQRRVPEWKLIELAAEQLVELLAKELPQRTCLARLWTTVRKAVYHAEAPKTPGGEVSTHRAANLLKLAQQACREPAWYQQAFRYALESLGVDTATQIELAGLLLDSPLQEEAELGEDILMWLWPRTDGHEQCKQAVFGWTDGSKRKLYRVLPLIVSFLPPDQELMQKVLRKLLGGSQDQVAEGAYFLQRYVRAVNPLSAGDVASRLEEAADLVVESVARVRLEAPHLAYTSLILVAESTRLGSKTDVGEVLEKLRRAWARWLQPLTRSIKWKNLRVVWKVAIWGLLKYALPRLPKDNPQNYKDLEKFVRLPPADAAQIRQICTHIDYHNPPPLEQLRELLKKVADHPNPLMRSISEFALIARARSSPVEVLMALRDIYEFTWGDPTTRSAMMQSCLLTTSVILTSQAQARQRDRTQEGNDQVMPESEVRDWFLIFEDMLLRMHGEGAPRGLYETGRGRISNPNFHHYIMLRARLLPLVGSFREDQVPLLIERAFVRKDHVLLEQLIDDLRVLSSEHHSWHLAVDPLRNIMTELCVAQQAIAHKARQNLVVALGHIRTHMPAEVDGLLAGLTPAAAEEWRMEVIRADKKEFHKEEAFSIAFHDMVFRFLRESSTFTGALRKVVESALEPGQTVQGWVLSVVEELFRWLEAPRG
jgi:hypothetical protein